MGTRSARVLQMFSTYLYTVLPDFDQRTPRLSSFDPSPPSIPPPRPGLRAPASRRLGSASAPCNPPKSSFSGPPRCPRSWISWRRNGRGEGASVPILDDGAGGRRPSRPGRSSATPRCGRPYERWTRRTRPGSALDLQKKKTAFGGSMKWEFLESRETKKKRGCARKPRGLIQDLKSLSDLVFDGLNSYTFQLKSLHFAFPCSHRAHNPTRIDSPSSHASEHWEGETTSRRPSTRTKVQHGARHRLKGRREGDCRNRLCLRQRCERCAAPPRSPR